MDIINSAINYLTDFVTTSEASYHVNPWVFGVLFFGSALPLYWGYFMIAKSALKIEGHKLKRKKIDKKQLRIGIVISVISWWIPYVYVILFGKLTPSLWLMFSLLILFVGILFVNTLRKKIAKAEKADR